MFCVIVLNFDIYIIGYWIFSHYQIGQSLFESKKNSYWDTIWNFYHKSKKLFFMCKAPKAFLIKGDTPSNL